MKNADGTYDKPDKSVAEWWEYEVCPISKYSPYRVSEDGSVYVAGCHRCIDLSRHTGRWLPLSSNTFPPKPEPPKPLEFVAGRDYVQRSEELLTCVGFKSDGKPAFENVRGNLCWREKDGRYPYGGNDDHVNDIIAEWTEPNPRTKVPRLFTAKYEGKEVRGCYFPREAAFGHDHVFPDECGTLWCEASQLTDIVYLTPEFEDEL